MNTFNIPIAVFMFKRVEKTVQIVKQIGKVKPSKIYLIGDGPRNESERKNVKNCRSLVEACITWDCEIIRNYATENRGVYQNIAGGAKWVFEREEMAIFLEDDNFPELSFFQYCKELLEKYKNDTRILWICGTNYMQKYAPMDGSDYVFTQLMLPCGWASWAKKFVPFYDGEMKLYRDDYVRKQVAHEYTNKLLYEHDKPQWDKIVLDIDAGKNPRSWDYQMAFSLRVNNLYGIAPKYNLIRNIGADQESIHGGVSMENEMTQRFCEVPTYEMSFPLKHPRCVLIDSIFEAKTEQIIILPLRYRIKGKVVKLVKYLLFIDETQSLSATIRKRFRRNK